ncbi:hypothetical protein HZS55_15840 [Halosimplex rubrum]|uniref:Blue (type 1) copper domain-containing protein n=1 Tax=Halosimplex rubrum TaxID=869889 RepID=A0A7D5T180_9EURY|nr:plastocyanin/azurin family copper-binding protein [Halosimplex rubrum]QLH78668.1 hypothetical protein HZS55_15840 [Halosimplex rubrum]
MSNVPATGWYVEVDHPDSDYTWTPTVYDDQARIAPAPYDYKRGEIPVEAGEQWRLESFEGAPMRVWKDGRPQPIEEFVAPEDGPGSTTTLVGIGGRDLDVRVTEQFDVIPVYEAAEQIIETYTDLTANIDIPETTSETLTISTGDSETDWAEQFDPSDPTSPIIAASGLAPASDGEGSTLARTSHLREAENINDNQVDFRGSLDGASNGEIITLETAGSYVEFDVELEHAIPADQGAVAIRFRAPNDLGNIPNQGSPQELPEITVSVDGESISPYGAYAQVQAGLGWIGVDGWNDDLAPGTHSVRVECTQTASGSPDYGDWFNNTPNYDGTTEDLRGNASVQIDVGNNGSRTFEHPTSGEPAIWVDPGTDVTWQWDDDTESHNVVEETGEFDSGVPITSTSVTYGPVTFDDEGVYRYYCETHGSTDNSSDGMKGAVVVGTDYDSLQNAEMDLDAVTLYDQRYHDVNAFSESTNANDALKYPADYPVGNGGSIPIQAFDGESQVRAVTGGEISVAVDDASGIERLGLSNDRGVSYTDSSAGVSTFSTDFADIGEALRWRVGLRGYGSRTDTTPTQGFERPVLDSWTLDAELEDIPLLVDQTYDGSAKTVLNEIAQQYGDAFWAIDTDAEGNLSFEWAEPGQRTADRDAPVLDFSATKTVENAVEKVTIKGSKQITRDEQVTADHGTWVDLPDTNLLLGQESVADANSSTEYSYRTDYELDAVDGRIRTLASGTIADGQALSVDYWYKPESSHTVDGAGSNPREIVRDLPNLPTERACGQVARILAQDLSEPLYEATVDLPPDASDWSVVEAIDLSQLPYDALEPRDTEETPEGVRLRLGSRDSAAERVGQIRALLGSTVRRS